MMNNRNKLPVFSLVKYGDTIALSCNEEVGQRISNALTDLLKKEAHSPVAVMEFNQHLKLLLNKQEERVVSHSKLDGSYLCNRLNHVMTVLMDQEFAKRLNHVTVKLKDMQLSPPFYSLIDQLDKIVQSQARPPYVDEIG